jgi:hypothetical protein
MACFIPSDDIPARVWEEELLVDNLEKEITVPLKRDFIAVMPKLLNDAK